MLKVPIRCHYSSYLSKNFNPKGLLIIKAMLGRTVQGKQEDMALEALRTIKALLDRTLQGKQEDMALEGLLIIKATLGKTLQGKQGDRALATGRGRKLV